MLTVLTSGTSISLSRYVALVLEGGVVALWCSGVNIINILLLLYMLLFAFGLAGCARCDAFSGQQNSDIFPETNKHYSLNVARNPIHSSRSIVALCFVLFNY